MLGITLDINGREIGRIGVWNTKETRKNDTLYRVYDIRSIEPGEHITDYPLIAEIWHDKRDRAAALTERVMAEINEFEHLNPMPHEMKDN